jgi:hypothetical protein
MAYLSISHHWKWVWRAFSGQADSGRCLFSPAAYRWCGSEMSCHTAHSSSPARSHHE